MRKGKTKILLAALLIAAALAAAFFAGGPIGGPADGLLASEPVSLAAGMDAPANSIIATVPEGPAPHGEPADDLNPASSGRETTPSVGGPSPDLSPGGQTDPTAPAGEKDGPDKTTTEAVPKTRDLPAASQLACTVEVRCNTLLDRLSDLPETLVETVPESGVVLPRTTVIFDQGESVFDATERACREKQIPFEFMTTPFSDSVYIEGIGNLYEFDGGELSGWVYTVNGEFPSYGCSLHTLTDGDEVVWLYTCDLGADVGGTNGPGGAS